MLQFCISFSFFHLLCQNICVFLWIGGESNLTAAPIGKMFSPLPALSRTLHTILKVCKHQNLECHHENLDFLGIVFFKWATHSPQLKLGVRNVCKFVSFLGMVLFSEKITYNILVPNFLDALASLERVMSVGGTIFREIFLTVYWSIRQTEKHR